MPIIVPVLFVLVRLLTTALKDLHTKRDTAWQHSCPLILVYANEMILGRASDL